MSDLAKLRQDHADLAAMFRQLSDYVSRNCAPPQLELFELRRKLVSTLIAHLKSEDWVLYPRLEQSADPTVVLVGRAFNQEMGGLAATFVEYNEKWSAPAIDKDWAGYCADTRGILEALTNRIVRENRELFPLLEALDKAA